jgi:hypothetical protein
MATDRNGRTLEPMREAAREASVESRLHPSGSPARSARRSASAAAQALTLQRLIGNRAASRLLARWIKHPDPDQKGVMVEDVVAADYVRFNPPKNA